MTAPKYSIQLEPLGKTIHAPHGTPLKDLLFEYGVEFPCGGKGICGGCVIKVLEGDILQEKTGRFHLKDKNLRLACQSSVSGNATIEIGQFETFILADQTEFKFIPRKGFGIAIDIGTTTIVAQLLDLHNGHILDAASVLNPQARYGADIISRIEYAVIQKGQAQLSTLVHGKIAEMVNQLIATNKVEVNQVVLVGNSVMQYIFGETDLTPLSAYPFKSETKKFLHFSPENLKLNTSPGARITFLPNIGSFVGSDVLAGIMASRMHESELPVALIDLGTNGEIAVGNKNRILCASTAAGPAFEGTNISMGMRATTGAISSVKKINGNPEYHVIGNVPPRGICGSGLIDVISVCLEKGKIDVGGKIAGHSDKIDLVHPVVLTQKDIRELQLAKGAIATGIHILSKHLGIEQEEISKVYIAGAFGTFIDLHHTRKIGLLDFPEEKITKLGNSALIGAKMALFLDEKDIEAVLNITGHLSLETDPGFQDIFAEKMMF